MQPHILNRPIWNALSTRQSAFAVGRKLALRFAPDIGPLASAKDDSIESLAELAELVPQLGTLILLQSDPIVIPPGIVPVKIASGVQMVLESEATPYCESHDEIAALTESDVPAMLELARLTQPGPFASGTPRLGEFLGIKEHGKLLAMAGERLKHSGYAEVSGVCVHPDARGRGFARKLSAVVASRIRKRGETPYLHAYSANTAAIRLYESLGFRLRCNVNVAVLGRNSSET